MNDVKVLATANTKTKKPRVKSPDWTEEEMNELLEAWAPKFSKLRGASQRGKIKIWNDIYSLYEERCPESQRTLQQVKKRQQNLDNEFKQLKAANALYQGRLKKGSPISTSLMR